MDKQAEKSLALTKIYSTRVTMARFANKTADLVLIQVYMPTAKHSDTETEETYELIEEVPEATKAEDNVKIMGDWNAIVKEGKDDNIVEQYGLGTRND